MELHTALALLKRFWWLLVAGALIGAVIAAVPRPSQPVERSYTAIARNQVNGLEFGAEMSTEIDYRINGAIALGLSDAQAREIMAEAGFDPGGPGEADDLVEFFRAVKVASLAGPAVQVEVTLSSPEVAARVADLVLDVYEPRLLAALPNQAGAHMGERIHRLSEDTAPRSGLSTSVMLGAVAGLLVAAIVVAIWYFRRRTVLSVPEVERITNLPVVAEVRLPRHSGQARGVQPDQMSLLATKIALLAGEAPRLVVWGSVSAAEVAGAASLAHAYADLHRGGSDVWEILGEGGTDPGDAGKQSRTALAEMDPSALTTAAVRQVVDEALTESGQLVAAADLGTPLGLAIMTAADASLVVVSPGRTLVSELISAIVDLRQTGITPTGIVLVQGAAR